MYVNLYIVLCIGLDIDTSISISISFPFLFDIMLNVYTSIIGFVIPFGYYNIIERKKFEGERIPFIILFVLMSFLTHTHFLDSCLPPSQSIFEIET